MLRQNLKLSSFILFPNRFSDRIIRCTTCASPLRYPFQCLCPQRNRTNLSGFNTNTFFLIIHLKKKFSEGNCVVADAFHKLTRVINYAKVESSERNVTDCTICVHLTQNRRILTLQRSQQGTWNWAIPQNAFMRNAHNMLPLLMWCTLRLRI